jgi:hypothetical protein
VSLKGFLGSRDDRWTWEFDLYRRISGVSKEAVLVVGIVMRLNMQGKVFVAYIFLTLVQDVG